MPSLWPTPSAFVPQAQLLSGRRCRGGPHRDCRGEAPVGPGGAAALSLSAICWLLVRPRGGVGGPRHPDGEPARPQRPAPRRLRRGAAGPISLSCSAGRSISHCVSAIRPRRSRLPFHRHGPLSLTWRADHRREAERPASASSPSIARDADPDRRRPTQGRSSMPRPARCAPPPLLGPPLGRRSPHPAGRVHPVELCRALRPLLATRPNTILVCDGGETAIAAGAARAAAPPHQRPRRLDRRVDPFRVAARAAAGGAGDRRNGRRHVRLPHGRARHRRALRPAIRGGGWQRRGLECGAQIQLREYGRTAPTAASCCPRATIVARRSAGPASW